MKILFLSNWYPFPADNGSKIRVLNLLNELACQAEVYFVSFSDDADRGQGRSELDLLCRKVVQIRAPRERQSRAKSITGYFSATPRSVVVNYSQELADTIRRLSREQDFDMVVASQIGMAPYALLARAPIRILEEVEITAYVDMLRLTRPLVKKGRFWITCLKHWGYVSRVVRKFHGCSVVSDREKQALLRLVPMHPNIEIIPNGIQLANYQGDFGKPIPDTLIYAGALTYSANLDAIRYFLADIFPLILPERSQARLTVTGSLKGVDLNGLAQNTAANFTGYLDDIRPAIARSWASIVPLRQGGGTRLKILESMALGTPVVATRKGAEGLDFSPDRDLLIADTSEEFARVVLRLLNDADLRETISRNGRIAVERYDWANIGPRFVDFVEQTKRMHMAEIGMSRKEVAS
jgi:glycosyltransferase involved in cell wall biosynthesis